MPSFQDLSPEERHALMATHLLQDPEAGHAPTIRRIAALVAET